MSRKGNGKGQIANWRRETASDGLVAFFSLVT